MEERRKSARINDTLIITVRQADSNLRLNAQIKNISEHGVCLRMSQHSSVNAILKLDILSEPYNIKIFTLTCVRWVVRKPAPKFPYEVGLEYTDISAADKDTLLQYLKSKKIESPPDIDWGK